MQNFRPLGALEEDILLLVSRASPKESWRTFLIPKCSLADYKRQGWHIKDALCSILDPSVHLKMRFYFKYPEHHPRSLWCREWHMHLEVWNFAHISAQNFRPLGALEVSNSYNGIVRELGREGGTFCVLSRVASQLKIQIENVVMKMKSKIKSKLNQNISMSVSIAVVNTVQK